MCTKLNLSQDQFFDLIANAANKKDEILDRLTCFPPSSIAEAKAAWLMDKTIQPILDEWLIWNRLEAFLVEQAKLNLNLHRNFDYDSWTITFAKHYAHLFQSNAECSMTRETCVFPPFFTDAPFQGQCDDMGCTGYGDEDADGNYIWCPTPCVPCAAAPINTCQP